jgi:hypothetical protein
MKGDEPRMYTRSGVLLGLAALALAVVPPASANQVFYYTNFGGSNSQPGSIQQVDVTTNTDTTLVGGLNTPDSLIFGSPTSIIFSQVNTGTVNRVNTNGTGNTVIASGLNSPEDMALDPGGQSVVVSDSRNNRVIRINLTTNAVTTLATFSSNVRGIAYDASGRLFVNVDPSQSSGTIVELDPLTGAVINSFNLPKAGDGLTFDPTTGALWTSTINNSGVIQIADNLSSATLFNCTLFNNTICGAYDGLEADGNGNLDLANVNGYIDQYNIATGTFSFITNAPGIDDLAPVIGLGSPGPPMPTPEPASALLVATGVFAMLLLRKRGFAKSERMS